ncbi:MAG TPA: hypothetical protein PLO41_06150 [Rubrivivax sp.]|nr:hypothetical protein [Rubrivivax sp.]
MQGGGTLAEAARRRVDVIEQDAHPHATRRGGLEAQQQQIGRPVVPGAVVLQVERALGQVRQRGSRGQRLAPRDDQAEAGPARMQAGRRAHLTPQCRDLRIGECMRRRRRHVETRRAAAGKKRQRQHEQGRQRRGAGSSPRHPKAATLQAGFRSA